MGFKQGLIDVAADTLSHNMAEADHRIANNLAMLSSYVRLKGGRIVQSDRAPGVDDVRGLVRMIVTQIEAISVLHRILSEKGNPSTLDLSVPLSTICRAMQASVAGEARILVTLEKNCDVALKSILPVTQICAEIITNALKHGSSPDGKNSIRVSCRKSLQGTVLVEISDTGPGLSAMAQAAKGEGLGVRLIDQLIRQVEGVIKHQSTSQGLTVQLELPAALTSTASPTGSAAAPSTENTLWHRLNCPQSAV